MNINGRPRSNAISIPVQKTAEKTGSPLTPSAPSATPTPATSPEKSLEERKAVFQRQLRTDPMANLSSAQMSTALEHMIDTAMPQDIAQQAGHLSQTGVSFALSASQEDDDWVIVEDKWVDKITTQDSDDVVIVSTVLDDAVSTITDQAKTIHGQLSLSGLKAEPSVPQSKPSSQVALEAIQSRYQDISKEFQKLDSDELTEGRMTAFEALKTTCLQLKADTATGHLFNQQQLGLTDSLDKAWSHGELSQDRLQSARQDLEKAKQSLGDMKALTFHSKALSTEAQAPVAVLEQRAKNLADQCQRCEAFLSETGSIDTRITEFQEQIETNTSLTQRDLDDFKTAARQSLLPLSAAATGSSGSALPATLQPVAQGQLKALENRIDALNLNQQRLALDPSGTLKEKSLDHDLKDVQGSGVDISAKLTIRWGESHQYDSKNKVTVHTTEKGAEVAASASGSAGPVDLGASLAIRGAKKRAYIQTVREGVEPSGLKITPPTSETLAKSPSKCLAQVGDTLILSQSMGVTAGVDVGAFGLTVGVEGSLDHEMRMSFQRAPNTSGDTHAPSSFYVRVEPENNGAALDGTVKWGPFAVSAGGSTSQSVFYEFEMSETQVQSFLANGKLPLLPDPKKYLLAYQDDGKPTVNEETFGAFDTANGNGMKLLRFGVSQEAEAHVSGSVAFKGVGAQGTFQKGTQKSVVVGTHHAQQRTQESTTKQSKMVFFGETIKHSELNESIRTRRTEKGLERFYEGASVHFSLSETQNNPDKLQAQLEEINTLLGRKSKTLLGEAKQLDQTRIQLELNLDPAGIQTLASRAKDLIANPSHIVVIAQKVGVSPAALLQVFEKVEHAEAGQHLDKNMSKEQQILRAQGGILGQFAKENGLKGMAALERLSGSELLSLTSESAFYANQLKAIDAENFALSADDSGSKMEFVEMVGKQQSLLILANDLDKAGPSVLSTEAKTDLLRDVKAHQALLDHKMGILLSSPKGRDAALSALLKSESGSSVSVSLRNAISDKLGGVIGPRIQNLSEQALQQSMEQVLEAYAQQGSPEEALAVFSRVIADQQTAFSEPLLDLLEKNQSSAAIVGIQKALPQHAPALVKTMGFEQQERLLKVFAHTPELPAIQQAVKAQRDQVETTYVEQFNMPQAYGERLEGYKAAIHDLDKLNALVTQITGDNKLPEDKRTFLLGQCQTRQGVAQSHLEKALGGSDESKRTLFNELMNPSTFNYVGNASHALMDRLIQADKTKPAQLQAYTTALLKAPDKEGLRIVTVLKHLEVADKAVLKATLEGIPRDKLKSLSNVSQTQSLADTLRKYRDNITSDLSPLIVEQLQSLVPEFDAGVFAKGVEKLQEKGVEKAEEGIQAGLSAAMTRVIDRLSGDDGSIRDRLFQLAVDSGATDKAEELRTLVPGYKGLASELTEIERKLNKRQDEVSQATQSGVEPTETRYKALLLGQRLNRFQMELNLQQGALAPTLGEPYMQPLSDQLKGLSTKMTADFALESLSAKDVDAVLTHLTDKRPDTEDLPEVNALVRGLLIKTPETSQTGILAQEKSVLTLYPKAAAPLLLATLNTLSPTDRSAALIGMSEKALEGFSKGLSHSDRNGLMEHLQAVPLLKPKLEYLQSVEPGYKEAKSIMTKIPLSAPALNALSGSALTEAFTKMSQQATELQKAKDLIDGLPEHAATSLTGVSHALTARENLVSKTALASLSSEQRQTLLKGIVEQKPTDFNKQVLSHMIEGETNLDHLQSHLKTLQEKDSKGNFSAHQFMLRNKLAKSPGSDPVQRSKTLEILTASGPYKKDNAQAVFEVLTHTGIANQEAMALLKQERTQKMFTQHIDNKAGVLSKVGVNAAEYGGLSIEDKRFVSKLCKDSHAVYKSLDESLPKAYSSLVEIDTKYSKETPLKRAVRKQPLQAELLAAKSELASLPEAYRLPLEAELDRRIHTLNVELTAVITPNMTDPLAQMKSFKSADAVKYKSLATLMVDKTTNPTGLEDLGKALAQDTRAAHFHDSIFKVVQKLTDNGQAPLAQSVFEQWRQSEGFDAHVQQALQSSEQRTVFAALTLPVTIQNQIRRITGS